MTPISYYGDKKMIKRKSMLPLMRVVTALMLLVVPTAIGRVATASAATDGSDNVRLSGFEVSAVTDGTAPFDDDDSDGNDSGASNGRVRSFDSVMYTMSYTTELIDEVMVVDEADIDVEIELPMSPKEAVFNMDSLNWVENPVVTYWREDGTSSIEWTAENAIEFVRQTVTGTRHIVNGNGGNAIPGTGTLVVGISVKASPNGTKIRPAMSIWMHGREAEKLTADFSKHEVTVSAKPSLNIRVHEITGNTDRYFDAANYTQQIADDETKQLVAGRMYRSSIYLSMRNTDEHGMKGYELPSDDITFDLNLTVGTENQDLTADPRFTPIFWDYDYGRMYAMSGLLGRQLGFATTAPNYGMSDEAIYDNGMPRFEQDGSHFSVTISDYGFDYKDYTYPKTDFQYKETNYIFAMCTVFFVLPLDGVSEVDPEDVTVKIEASNISFAGESGARHDEEYTLDDNAKSTVINAFARLKDEVQTRPDGYPDQGVDLLAKQVSFANVAISTLDGDRREYIGAPLTFDCWFNRGKSRIVTDCDMLIKFDSSALDVSSISPRVSLSDDGRDPATIFTRDNWTILYAAKPDGTVWDSDDEMDVAHEENLIFFESHEALRAAGCVCVGILIEIRGAMTQLAYPGLMIRIDNVLLSEDAEPGTTAKLATDWRVWDGIDDVSSWKDFPYDGVDNAYGVGDATLDGGDALLIGADGYSGMFADGYDQPTHVVYSRYEKTQYNSFGDKTKNGTAIRSGTDKQVDGSFGGATLYVMSGRATVDIAVSDSAGGTEKTTFDLDMGERTAWYTVTPKLVLTSGGESTARTDARVEVTLPDNVSYMPSSASVTPSDITYKDNGEVNKLTFTYENVLIEDSLPAVSFAVTIGKAGTEDDIKTGTSLSCMASIYAGFCQRNTGAPYERDYATFNVVRLSTSSVMKSVRDIVMPKLSDNQFTLRFGNTSDQAMSDVTLYDPLPYDGDRNGSSFSGGYRITGIDIDLTHAPTLLARFADAPDITWTNSIDARVTTTDEVEGKLDDSSITWNQIATWNTNGSHVAATGLDIADMMAFRFEIGNMPANEYFDIILTVDFADADGNAIADAESGTQQPNDLYANSFYEWSPDQPATVRSNVVQTTVEYIDIALTKTADPTSISNPVAGTTTIDYEFVIENTGKHALHNVTLTDDMLDGVSVVTIDWDGSTDPSTSDGTLSAGEQVTATATYTITQADIDAGSVTNEATTTGENESGTDEVSDTDDTTTTITGSASISLVKDVDKTSVDMSQDDGSDGFRTLTYTFTVTNTGSLTLHDVALTDEMLGDSASIDWSTSTVASTGDGILAPGEVVFGKATYVVSQADIDAGSVTNTAIVTGTDPNDEDVTDDDDAETDLSGSAAIELVKDVDKAVVDLTQDGGSESFRTLSYSFTVTNTGSLTLHDVILTDEMLGDTASIDWATDTDDATGEGILSPGESVSGTASYILTQDDIESGIVTNVATVTGTPSEGEDVSSTDDVVTTITNAEPAISLEKSVSNTAPVVGEQVRWLFDVTNTGDLTLYNVTVSDPMVDNVDYGDWDRTLAPGESKTVHADYIVDASDVNADGSLRNTATVTGEVDGGGEVPPVEDESTVEIEVETHPHLTIAKSVDKKELSGDSAVVGAELRYSFLITNDGDVTVSDVAIIDELEGLSEIEFDWANSSDEATGEGVLSPGESVSASTTYVVTQDDLDASKVPNVAVATGKNPNGSDVTSDESSVETTITVPEFELKPEPVPEPEPEPTPEPEPEPEPEPDANQNIVPSDDPNENVTSNQNVDVDEMPEDTNATANESTGESSDSDDSGVASDALSVPDGASADSLQQIVETGAASGAVIAVAATACTAISGYLITRKISKK